MLGELRGRLGAPAALPSPSACPSEVSSPRGRTLARPSSFQSTHKQGEKSRPMEAGSIPAGTSPTAAPRPASGPLKALPASPLGVLPTLRRSQDCWD